MHKRGVRIHINLKWMKDLNLRPESYKNHNKKK